MSNDLIEAKQRLLDKLGHNYDVYIQLLGKWFRGFISKDEFDKSAKQLIEQNFVLEHNKFWLAFFHHCANSATGSIHSQNFRLDEALGKHYNQETLNQGLNGTTASGYSPGSISARDENGTNINSSKVRCLPNKVITHMKIYVIAWEMGLDSASDHVSLYINLALQHFLKNIITELICTKTAYRLRENRFKYAIGVKPMNPYLSNSLKIYSSNLEYDPYQIESNKMNSSLVDTYAYNDSLFPSRLYEAQALYEYACSTTSAIPSIARRSKKIKLSEFLLDSGEDSKSKDAVKNAQMNGDCRCDTNNTILNYRAQVEPTIGAKLAPTEADVIVESDLIEGKFSEPRDNERRLTLFHLLIAFLSNSTIIPSQSLYSINLERIFTKLSC